MVLTLRRYHSHSGIQRADGLYGGLIVHQPLEGDSHEIDTHQYKEESLLMLGDWYHRSAEEVQQSYVNHDSWGREVRLRKKYTAWRRTKWSTARS